ncbi:MAG TPA: response regulator [Mucilaginibacter sp.]|nr:response regulator [Mucilaginibacter sp.]
MSTELKYIIVDDDPFNNTICRMIIEDALGEVEIEEFTKPEEGLLFIQENIKGPSILFLDINMPTLTGWEFLEQYEKFSEEVKMHVSIYILSSSLDWRDKDKANANKYVKGFISKPLEFETVISIAKGEFQA